jgi:hypothetical protein
VEIADIGELHVELESANFWRQGRLGCETQHGTLTGQMIVRGASRVGLCSPTYRAAATRIPNTPCRLHPAIDNRFEAQVYASKAANSFRKLNESRKKTPSI